jgi:hypothetical protein
MLRTAAIVLAFAVPVSWAQAIISAHSGMVNYVEGDARLEGRPIKLNGAIFPDVKVGQTLTTGRGHAEILLTPGVFLRLDHNTSFRMVSNQLTHTQIEILRGSALVEADEIIRDNRIAVKVGSSETLLLKNGLYHFNADAGQVRTFTGKAQVSDASNSTELKGGRTLLIGSSLNADKFDKKKSRDDLYAWSQQRDQGLALANISAARTTRSRGLTNSLWAWNSWLGAYTFLPRSGYGYSPFGFPWYSPGSVWVVFQPAPNDGYQGGGSASTSSFQGVAPSSVSVSSMPVSNASTGDVGRSSSSAAATSAGAGGTRSR